MTSDDLDLREGHLELRTMLGYVTDPNDIDSWATLRLFLAFSGGKALNVNVKHFVFYLTCDVTGDPGSNIFQPDLKDLVQGSPLPVNFFRHVYWLPR